jgi:hypothetical protein
MLWIEVANTGTAAGSPECMFKAIDPDGVLLAGDVVDLSSIDPGKTLRIRVLTGLEPGEHLVAKWRAACS